MIESDFDSLLPGTATVDVTNRRTDLKVALGVGYMPPQLFPSWLKPPSKHPTPADTCRHLPTRCAGGLCAIAPDLYARQGDAKGYKEIAKLMSEVVSKVPDAQVMADLDAAVQWAGKNGGNTKKVADTGFCCGGRI